MKNTLRFVAVALMLGTAPAALAQGTVPERVSVNARMVDSQGAPVTGSHAVEFALFDIDTGGTALWTEANAALTFSTDGLFAVELGATTPLTSTVLDGRRLFLQLTVDSTPMLPRIPIVSVPYALRSTTAVEAGRLGTLTPSDVQERVSGTCNSGEAIRVVNADGTVTCQSTGGTYSAGTGISISGTTLSVDSAAVQSRVTGTCASGSSIRTVNADGSVVCETFTDTNTTYTAGSGLTLAGTTFSANTSVLQSRVTGTCAAGSSIRVINTDGTVGCEADSNTMYTAGAGMVLSGTTFAADRTVMQQRVTGTCAAGSSIRAIDIVGGVTCEPDTDTAYSAGSGLTLSGTSLSTDNSVVARKDSAAGNQAFDTNLMYLDYANNRVGIGTASPASGYALEVNGSAITGLIRATDFEYRFPQASERRIPGVAFNSHWADARFGNDGTLYFQNGAAPANGSGNAYLDLPAGVTITGLTCYYYDNDLANAFLTQSIALRAKSLSSPSYTTIASASVSSSGNSSSSQSFSAAAFTHVVSGSQGYWLNYGAVVSPAGSPNLRLEGCRLTYTRPAPD